MINKSNITHAIIALSAQFLVWLVTDDQSGAIAAVAFLFGREFMDRQRQIVAANRRLIDGARSVAELPLWAALDVWNWSRDAIMDVACPFVAAVVAALIFY